MVVTTISAIFLAIEIAILITFVTLAIVRDTLISKSNILYFIPLFAMIFVLYLLGISDVNDEMTFLHVMDAISSSIKSFAFEINSDLVGSLLNSNVVFKAAFYLGILMASLTVLDSFLGLFKKGITNAIRVRKAIDSKCDFLLSIDEHSIEYAKHNNALVMCDSLSDSDKDMLYENKIAYLQKVFNEKTIKGLGLKKDTTRNFIDFSFNDDKFIGMPIISRYILQVA